MSTPPALSTASGVRLLALCLCAQLLSCSALNVLLFPVYDAKRQALFDAVRDNLALADHNVTLLVFEEDFPYAHQAPPQTLTVSRNASAPYGASRQLELWERQALVSHWSESLAAVPPAYLTALADRCRAVLDDQLLLEQLRLIRADLLVTDAQGNDLCGLTLALKLGSTAATPGKSAAGPPVVVGVVAAARLPEALSHYTASPYHPALLLAPNDNLPSESALQHGWGRRLGAVWSYVRNLCRWDKAYTGVALQVACDHLRRCPTAPQLYQQLALLLVNGDSSVEVARPYYPSTVFIGGITCTLATLLTKETESFVRSHRAGAILVTFELSSIAAQDYPPFLLDSVLQGLGRMPYAVLWKVNSSVTQGRVLPKNFMLEEKLSIQDVMGHGRTRLVINLCSSDTVFGALFHSVPLLCLPLLDEQVELARRTTARGLGLTLTLDKLTPDTLTDAVQAIVTNTSFKQTIRQYNELLRDHSDTPQDRLLYWMEYVVRRRGAPHLRNVAAVHMSYWLFFMVDVVLSLLGIAIVAATALAGACLALARYALSRRRRSATCKPKSE